MNIHQRWLAVLALGAGAWVGAQIVSAWFFVRDASGGWFEYAPSNAVAVGPSSTWIGRDVAINAVAIIGWFLLSRRILAGSAPMNIDPDDIDPDDIVPDEVGH